MKKITVLSVLMILLIIFTGCSNDRVARKDINSIKSYKEIPGITQEEISAIEALKESRQSFSYGHLLEAEAFKLQDGTFAGFTIKVCALLSELFGAEFVPQYCVEWEILKNGIDNRTIDFTGDFSTTDERSKFYSMTGPISGRGLKIYTNAYSDEIKTESDLNGRKVGFMRGTVTAEALKERYADLSLKTVDVYSFLGAAEMLRIGVIDAFIIDGSLDPQFENYSFIQSRELFQPVYTHVSIATANPELAPLIAVIEKYLNAGGVDRIYKLYDEGKAEYTKNKLYQSFTAEEKAYIAGLKERNAAVSVAFENDNYPVSFYNTVDKEFQGIAVDVLAAVSRLTDIKFESAVGKDATWSEIYEKAKSGEISMVDELLYSEEWKEHFIWSSEPYSRSYYALISKLERPNFEFNQIVRTNVGVLRQSAAKNVFYETFPHHANTKDYATRYDCLDALEKGEIDFLMASEYMLLTQTNYREKPGFKADLRFKTPMDSRFGFNKNEYILRSIIDKAQKHVQTDAIVLSWTGRVFDYSKKISQMQTVYVSIFAGGLLLVLLGMSFLLLKNNRLRKNLAERTTTLSTIYSSIPETIFCKNTEGVYTRCNLSFAKQAGMSETELIGKTYAQVFKERVSETVELYRDIDKKVMSERSTEIIEETVVYPDGSFRLLETLKAPLIQNGNVIGLLGIGRDVTERKEVKSRFEYIINTAQVAFILSIDGIIVEVNEYSQKHLGIKAGDTANYLYSEPGQRETIHKEAEQRGTVSNIIVKFKMSNGEVHRFLSTFTFVEYEKKRAYLMWATDVEQDMVKSDLLNATQQSLQTVLDVLPVPIRIVELDSKEILYVNGNLLELLEYEEAEEVCGLKITDIMPDVLSSGELSSEIANLVTAEESKTIAIEAEYCTKTGEIVEAVVVSRQIDYMGKRSSIGIIKDLAAEKERAQILLNAAEREKEANQLKTRFLANMSHEIRTPMNSIIGMTELLMAEKLSGRQMQYVKDVKTSAESLLDIINDILDLSRIGEGKLKLMPFDVELNRVLKNTVSMMSFSARSKGLDFIDDIHLNTPEYVYVDDVRLSQIIVNLLSNAIKYTKTGHVKLSVRIEDDNIRMEISDTGVGIREEGLSQIFSAFEQVGNHRNRAIMGTGLGLSIVKNLVGMMDGKIWAESEYGVGTTFYVTIPYVPGDESAVELIENEFNYISSPTAKILIVDDIQTNLTVGAGLLRMCGITADVALSGYEAIELVKTKDYDIVFMDHMMPEMDGVETMQFIKGMGGKYSKLPIIALTANAVNESRDFLLASGMDDFLSKPIDKVLLMDILLKWLPTDKIKVGPKHAEDAQPATYTEVLTAAAEIEGLDIELALSRIGGMQDVLEEAIKQVAYSISGELKKMDAFLSGGDLRGFAIEAHGLKGALANIGATANSELAAGLEIASKAENAPLCIDKFAVFVDQMESFAAKLKTVFLQAETTGKSRGEKEFLAAKIGEAISYLDGFETEEALECLNALAEFTFGEDTDAKLNDVKDAVKTFSYEKATLLLEEIKENCF